MHEGALRELCMSDSKYRQLTFSVKTEDLDIFRRKRFCFEVKVSCFRRKSCQNHHFETDVNCTEMKRHVIIRAHSQDDTILLSRKEKVPE